jgi:hypothetical protein
MLASIKRSFEADARLSGNSHLQKTSECSRLESVKSWRKHENYIGRLPANWIGDNQEFACAVGFPSNIANELFFR